MFVNERFILNSETCSKIMSMTPSMNALGSLVYYRTYSLVKSDGTQEQWGDTVIRVTQGVFSILKDHYVKNHLFWNENYWQDYATGLSLSLFKMHILTSGRSLFKGGTDYVYQNGSAALNNCSAISSYFLSAGSYFAMDMLMCGCGVGFSVNWTGRVRENIPEDTFPFQIPDNRQGWAASITLLIEAFVDEPLVHLQGVSIDISNRRKMPIFDYSIIRPKGSKISGFGGTASGHGPLKILHHQITAFLTCYLMTKKFGGMKYFIEMIKKLDLYNIDELNVYYQTCNFIYSKTHCVADIMNCIGACVVAGNTRRSAEILIADVDNIDAWDLKNTNGPNKYRESFSWMSNNTIAFNKTDDFSHLPKLAKSIQLKGEPGFLNRINMKRGRLGMHKESRFTRESEIDSKAIYANPCSEICLEGGSEEDLECCIFPSVQEPLSDTKKRKIDYHLYYPDKVFHTSDIGGELCNLSEVFPTMCLDEFGNFNQDIFMKSIEYATFYATTISLLATQNSGTNEIISRNRRIGVSISGIADWCTMITHDRFIRYLRDGYTHVRETNKRFSALSGVAPSLRVTCVKPSGTLSLLANSCSPGIHSPTFRYYIRRVRVGADLPIAKFMADHNIRHEPDKYSQNTEVFEFVVDQSKCKPATEVSIWEQMKRLECLSSEWSDNMTSMTGYFNKNEINDLETVLALFAPSIKSVSMLPHTDQGVYDQAPYEGITKEIYEERIKEIKPIDWSIYSSGGLAPIGEKYCTNDTCTL